MPGIKCKKHDVLRLQVNEYEEWADLVQIGYEEAAKFLHRQFVFTHNNVPYGTQLVPLAALFVELSSGELHSAKRPRNASSSGIGAACWASATARGPRRNTRST